MCRPCRRRSRCSPSPPWPWPRTAAAEGRDRDRFVDDAGHVHGRDGVRPPAPVLSMAVASAGVLAADDAGEGGPREVKAWPLKPRFTRRRTGRADMLVSAGTRVALPSMRPSFRPLIETCVGKARAGAGHARVGVARAGVADGESPVATTVPADGNCEPRKPIVAWHLCLPVPCRWVVSADPVVSNSGGSLGACSSVSGVMLAPAWLPSRSRQCWP